MKSMTRFTIAAVLLGTVLLLTGCNDIKLKSSQITFKATAGEVGTKTSYGDDYPGGDTPTTYQYIDWVSGDLLRIVSDKAAGPSAENYADYVVTAFETGTNNHQSYATIEPTPNGLAWTGTGKYQFYAVYPSPSVKSAGGAVSSIQYTNDESNVLGEVVATLPNTVALSGSPGSKTATVGGETCTYAVYAPDMKKAVMTAAATGVDGDTQVNLVFKPAFTAFEFNLSSADDDFTITQIELAGTGSDYLAGQYQMKAGDLTNVTPSGGSHSVTLTMGDGLELTPTSGVTFTLFTIPKANTGMLNLKVTVKEGENATRVATLPLTKANSTDPYVFDAGKKYRINGLALKKGSKWQLEIDGNVLPWAGTDKTIDQQVSIQGKVAISGTIESTKVWQQKGGWNPDTESYINAVGLNKDNHYADSEWAINGTTGYDKNYQIRTLNRDLPESERYFTMTFTPTAPTGGYWKLIPTFKEGDNESYKHYSFEVILPGGEPSTQLTGPIINSEVTVKIHPKDWSMSDMNTYDMWFTCYFSPSINFTPSISADSEFQDVHGDGRFSYWVFRLAQYSDHWIDE